MDWTWRMKDGRVASYTFRPFLGTERFILGGEKHAVKSSFIGREHRFEQADGSVIVLATKTNFGFAPRAELRVDGEVSTPLSKPETPAWAYVFVVACIAIPIITLGGALPAVLGIGGAFLAMGAARNTGWPLALRVGGAAASTAVAWGGLIALGLLVGG